MSSSSVSPAILTTSCLDAVSALRGTREDKRVPGTHFWNSDRGVGGLGGSAGPKGESLKASVITRRQSWRRRALHIMDTSAPIIRYALTHHANTCAPTRARPYRRLSDKTSGGRRSRRADVWPPAVFTPPNPLAGVRQPPWLSAFCPNPCLTRLINGAKHRSLANLENRGSPTIPKEAVTFDP